VRGLTERLTPLVDAYAVIRFARAHRDAKLTALAGQAIVFPAAG
jgi:hypothetical protein